MKLILREFTLPLRHPFTIARGTTTILRTLVVELVDGPHHGYGEGPENPYYGCTIESMSQHLDAVRAKIESHPLRHPAHWWEQLADELQPDPFARCALDEAAHDLWGKRLGQPVYRLWGLTAGNLPPTSFTIGIDRMDVMVAKLRAMPGWPIYKIKLGTPDDIEIVRRLRAQTDAVFRVDANGAWDVAETLRNAEQLQPLGVEFIEQPLDPSDWDGMKEVHARSVLPLIADESCGAARTSSMEAPSNSIAPIGTILSTDSGHTSTHRLQSPHFSAS